MRISDWSSDVCSSDLVDVDLGQFTDTLKGKRVRGRVEGENLVPYYDRTAIEQGVLSGDAPVIAWGADPVEVFFLQIQGSGNLRLPDGGVLRLGYDDQNGRDYRSEEHTSELQSLMRISYAV